MVLFMVDSELQKGISSKDAGMNTQENWFLVFI